MKFTFFSDPGHGWVKVPLALIKELGIARDITQYSYIKGDWVYLEEDCDAYLFKQKMDLAGKPVEFVQKTTNTSSRIRAYERYKAWIYA